MQVYPLTVKDIWMVVTEHLEVKPVFQLPYKEVKISNEYDIYLFPEGLQ